MAKLLLLNGPNLNLLGTREPEIYGYESLSSVTEDLVQQAAKLGHELKDFQSNHEGALIDEIHTAFKANVDFIIINPGAYTHTSIALRDALAGVNIPFIELHLSNVHAREEFRQHSFLAELAVGVLAGFGTHTYQLALQAADTHLKKL